MFRILLTALLLAPAIHANVIGGVGYIAPGAPGWTTTCTAPLTCTSTGTQFSGFVRPDGSHIDIPVMASYSITGDDTFISMQADSTLNGGSGVSGFASTNGSITFNGGTGAGYAQFELSWTQGVKGGFGSAGVAGFDLDFTTATNRNAPNGTVWSRPLPFTWGDPLPYSFGVSANMLGNLWGDCCEGFDVSASITEWRVSGGTSGVTRPRLIGSAVSDPTAVPEPGTIAMVLVGILLAYLARKSPRHAD